MEETKIAGILVKPEVSLGNLLTAITMLSVVIAYGVSLDARITTAENVISRGILSSADKRVTALETAWPLEMRSIRTEIVNMIVTGKHAIGYHHG